MGKVNEALDVLQEQYEEEADPVRKAEIKAEYLRAIGEVEAIAERRISENDAQYEEAIGKLEEANAELKQAREDLANFAEAIKKVANAVNMLADVAARVV